MESLRFFFFVRKLRSVSAFDVQTQLHAELFVQTINALREGFSEFTSLIKLHFPMLETITPSLS